MNSVYSIERIKTEDGFLFRNKKKVPITNKMILDYLKTLYVPPAYENVFFTKNKKIHCYAIAIDDKKRKQYFYRKEWSVISRQNKINSLYNLSQYIQKLHSDLKKMLTLPLFSNEHGEKVLLSLFLHIMLYGNFRIGSENGRKKYKSYGVSTLQKEHVHFIDKHKVSIEFHGKKNIINKTTIRSKRICQLLHDIIQNNSNSTLFHLDTPSLQCRITPLFVNDFLKSYGSCSSKVLRTWYVNTEYLKHLYKTNSRTKALSLTADSFHHTKTVCKKSYLFPEMYQTEISDTTTPNQIFVDFLFQNKKL